MRTAGVRTAGAGVVPSVRAARVVPVQALRGSAAELAGPSLRRAGPGRCCRTGLRGAGSTVLAAAGPAPC